MTREYQAKRVLSVTMKLWALSHISPDHFRGHFFQAARSTIAEGAELHLELLTDLDGPHAQDVILDSIARE